MSQNRLKDPRILMLLSIYLIGLLNFVKARDTRLVEYWEMDSSASLYNLIVNKEFWGGVILLIVPILLILCVMFLNKLSSSKKVYIVGSILGAVATIVVVILAGNRFEEYIEISSGVPAIGFYLMLAIWIAVFLWTHLKDEKSS